MLDFELRKEKNIFNPIIEKDEPILTTEQSKFINNISIKSDNEIKNIRKEINQLKCQIYDILNLINTAPLSYDDQNSINKYEKIDNLNINNIKIELFDYINKEVKNQIKENIQLLSINNYLNKSTNNLNYKRNINNENNNLNNHILNESEYNISSSKFNKINKNIFNEKFNSINKSNRKQILFNENNNYSSNEDDIIEKNKDFNQNDINETKKDIFQNFENFKLKILNELKNQAYDIKTLYEEIQNLTNKSLKNEFNTINNDISENLLEDINKDNTFNMKKISNFMYIMENELSKKVDLEQLNYALQAQTKLNEALALSCKICRLSWDSDDILINNKYIKWSIQNINTALDVFKWEKNSGTIKIMQKGVYKILVGLIGLENDKNIIIFLGNNYIDNKYEKILKNVNNLNRIKNYNDIDNIIFVEKYFACVENTEIKIGIFDDNNNRDCSEEAFLELKKII